MVGATTLLMTMCAPLSAGFLVYHVYLLWIGATTNETSKWADFKEDVADGLVFRAEISELRKAGKGRGRGRRKARERAEHVQGNDEHRIDIDDDADSDDDEEGSLPEYVEPKRGSFNWPPNHHWPSPGWIPSWMKPASISIASAPPPYPPHHRPTTETQSNNPTKASDPNSNSNSNPNFNFNPTSSSTHDFTYIPRYWYIRIPTGEPPTLPNPSSNPPPSSNHLKTTTSSSNPNPTRHNQQLDPRWHRITSLNEVKNIYDLGFWGCVWEIIFHRD
jgi:hypothetical protein